MTGRYPPPAAPVQGAASEAATETDDMTPFGIAGVQMDVPAGAALGDRRDRMRELIAETRRRFPWVRLVLFSELAAFGDDPARAEPFPGPVERGFRKVAAEAGLWLVPGTFLEREGDRLYNVLPVIDPAGEVVLRYRKILPWLPYEGHVSAGDAFGVFDVPGVGRFGVSICYDMMLPETVRQLAFLGAEVVLHPTMTTTLDREQELVVGRANAIFNQCYLLDVNGAGALGVGRSQLVGPEGERLHLAGEREEIMPIRVDLDRVRSVRRLGTAGTVQLLKTFRDCPVRFPAYEAGAASPALEALGPLDMPTE